MASLFRPWFRDKATGERRRYAKWYAKLRGADGVVRKVPLSTNKTAAGQMLAALVRKVENEKAGIADPFDAHRRTPLSSHLDDWAAGLTAGGATPKHVAQTVQAARRVIDGCGFVFHADVSASPVQRYLAALRRPGPALTPDRDKASYTKAELAALLGIKACGIPSLVKRHKLGAAGNGRARRYPRETAEALAGLRGAGMSVKSANMHLAAVKQFAGWLVRDRRAADNPLAHLAGGNPESDRRREFPTLTADELRRLIAAARGNLATYRGLTGPDRAVVYTLAVYTALRPGELASLTPADFVLDAAVPFVRLDGGRTKNGRAAEQAIPAAAAAELRAYLPTRPAAGPVWPGTWHEKAADMIRVDLPAAGIPASKPGPDGRPLTVGFYSLRHSAGPLAEAGGATLREVMTLMRHSDPKLTLKTYGRLRLEDRGVTVAKMPGLSAPTGTDSNPDMPPVMDRCMAQHGPNCGPVADHGRGRLRTGEDSSVKAGSAEVLKNKAFEETGGPERTTEESSPGRIRTYDPPVNSRLLYR